MQQRFETSPISNVAPADYPAQKLTIVGGGIVGFLEAYYAYLDAKRKDERLRVTIHEKHPTMKGTTTAHLIPNLTPYEILSVVPRGQDLINKLSSLFSEQEGIRVDDVAGVNGSIAANEFIRAVQEYGQDEEGHRARTETLLALGKMSMELWQEFYTHADAELKAILVASNFNPCRELTNPDVQILHDGYRIDLIYRVPNAVHRANATMSDYARLGYTDCKTLSTEEVMRLDPFLTDFCIKNSELNEDGTRVWNNDAVAYWRPGGCLDTQVFLPLFHDYLKRVMGQYTNDAGITKDCFQLRFQRQVEQVAYESPTGETPTNRLNGLKFFGNPTIKHNKHAYQQSDYVFCPGEAVGTLKKLGFAEPEYARFAGASIMLRINIPAEKLEAYSTFSHHMSVYQDGVSSAWQARCIGNQIFIGLAGTKAFYGDQEPHKDQAFARNRNLVQLNMINDVLPEFISLALGKPTQGIQLTEADMEQLELHHIAERWAGSRAVAYDGFLTVGSVYNHEGRVSNARCTTQLGSGGASLSHAAVLVSRSSMFIEQSTSPDLTEKVLTYGDSQRTGNKI
ncbi:MAG: hypothetical protein Q8R79_00670 [Legionellaceae bacterium]|nr:hypothetical protein [Legionellaceae bacterium]